jgi:hypothetical protein
MGYSFCGSRLSDHLSQDNAGNLIAHRVVIARSGIQGYRGSEIGLDTDNLVTVIRPVEEVLSKATIASAQGKVLTDGHPPRFLTPDSAGAYSRGFVLHAGEGAPLANGDRTLVADLVITDGGLQTQILGNTKREVSCGYTCDWERTDDGKYLCTNIRVNHVAVVPRSRCGTACAIRDHDGGNMDKMAHATKVLREINEFIKQRYGDANDAEPLEQCLTELRRQEAEDFEKTAALYHRRRPCEARQIAAQRNAEHRKQACAADNEAQPTSLREFMEEDARQFERAAREAGERMRNAPR